MTEIWYSDLYFDDTYMYRHVKIPKDMVQFVPRNRLMHVFEWRRIGVQQSSLWEHYLIHNPEPHILLFRRKLPVDWNKENKK